MTARKFLFGLVLSNALFGLAGCQTLFGEDQSSAVAAGTVCTRHHEELTALLSQPKSCVTSATCPVGSHCSDKGVCDFSCYANTDCSPTEVCDCLGFCVAEGTVAQADAGTRDPLCERDRTKLVELATQPRTCFYIDDCPNGSYCQDRQCKVDCYDTSDAVKGCATGVCDCTGRCQTGAPASPLPPSDLPVLTVSPNPLHLLPPPPMTEWTARRVDFHLEAVNQKLLEVGAVKPTVTITASDGLGVVCSETGRATATYPTSCTLDGAAWTLQADGQGLQGSRYIWVKPTLGTAQTTFTLKIAAPGVAHAQQKVLLDVVAPAATPTTTTTTTTTLPTTPADGVWSGELELEASADVLPGLATTRVPVTVWKKGTTYLFYDPTRLIAPGGKLRLQANVGGTLADFPPPQLAWVAGDPKKVLSSGAVLATAGIDNLGFAVPTQTLGGAIVVTLPIGGASSTRYWTFSLSRQDALPQAACTGQAQCQATESCDVVVGVCVPGVAFAALGTGSAANTLVHQQRARWRAVSSLGMDAKKASPVGTTQLWGSNTLGVGQSSPAGLAESMLCYDEADPTQLELESCSPFAMPWDSLNVQGFANLTLPISGDLACQDGKAPGGFGLFAHRDAQGSSALGAGAMLRACLDDLEAEPVAVDAGTNWLTSAKAQLKNKTCVSLARVFAALDYLPLTRSFSSGVTGDDWGPRDQRLYQHLLTQWLGLHSFVAYSGTQESGAAQVLGSTGSADDEQPTSDPGLLASVLTQLEAGWSLILDPQTQTRLLSLPPLVLRYPDSRQRGPVAYFTFDSSSFPNKGSLSFASDARTENHVELLTGSVVKEAVVSPSRGGLVATGTSSMPSFFRERPYGPALNGEVTVSFWLRVDGADAGDVFVFAANKYDAPPNYAASLEVGTFVDANGKVGFFAQHKGKGSSDYARVVWPYRAAKGTILHVTVVRQNKGSFQCDSEYALYINGTAQSAGTRTGSVMPHPLAPVGDWFVNRQNLNNSGASWTGLLDELAIWERALSLADIAELYAAGRSGAFQPLLVPIPPDHDPNHEQEIGLPVSLVETMSAHLRALERFLADERNAVYLEAGQGTARRNAALERLGVTLRHAALVEELARKLHGQATLFPCRVARHCEFYGASTCWNDMACVGTDGEFPGSGPPWTTRWNKALNELAAVRSQAVDAGRELQKNENPLGIGEDDLPLFFGDPQGASGRFFASSDYLVGTWAAPAVASARAALAEARDAWLGQRNSGIQEREKRDEAERRLETLRAQYARPIIEACGLVGADTQTILEDFETGRMTPDNCFVDKAAPAAECKMTVPVPSAGISNSSIQYSLCVINKRFPRVSVGCFPAGGGECSPGASLLEPSCPKELLGESCTEANALVLASKDYLGGSSFKDTISITKPDSTTLQFALQELIRIRGIIESEAKFGIRPGQPRDLSERVRRSIQAKATCVELLGNEFAIPALESLSPKSFSVDTCLRGKIGEGVYGILSASNELGRAMDEWVVSEEQYRNEYDQCLKDAKNAAYINELSATHVQHVSKIVHLREVASAISGVVVGAAMAYFTGGASVAAGGAGAVGGSAWSRSGGLISAGVQGATSILLSEFSNSMEEENAQFEHQLRVLQNHEKVLRCFFEADKKRAGIGLLSGTIKGTLIGVGRAIVQLNNLKRQIPQLVIEARSAIDRESGRTVPSIAHHYWLDEKVERFKSEFEWAQRLTFLGMRAVEFEFQQSLPLRDDILTATNPSDLEGVIRELQREQASRTINRRRPEESNLVLSLRDDILKLADHSDAPYGERRWTPDRRFRERLWSPENAIRDEKGNYLGQGIRFSLTEEGELKLRCAERLWRVTATVQGDLLGTSEPHVPMVLLKSNTFSSQYCDDRGGGEKYQVASLRPTSQLFRGQEQGGKEAGQRSFSSAFLFPWFNVRRSDFYRDQYQEGASEELAGRGLYGEYILLFPYDGLLEPSVNFALDHVEDVLVRFDYLSVDDVPNL